MTDKSKVWFVPYPVFIRHIAISGKRAERMQHMSISTALLQLFDKHLVYTLASIEMCKISVAPTIDIPTHTLVGCEE